MPDLSSIVKVQKAKWVQLYINNHKCRWHTLMPILIGVENLDLLLLCNFNKLDFAKCSQFYQEVLCAFCEIRHLVCDLFKQFLHYNKNVKIGNNYIYSKDFLAAGIWSANDLFENGKLIHFNVWQSRGLLQKHYMLWRSIVSIIKERDRKSVV